MIRQGKGVLWPFRAIWEVLRAMEVVVVSVLPAGAARTHIRWRLRGRVRDDNRCSFLCRLADAERRRGDLAASEAAAREALAVAPDYWYAHVELALTLEATGRRAEAAQVLRELLEKPEFDRTFETEVRRKLEGLAANHPRDR